MQKLLSSSLWAVGAAVLSISPAAAEPLLADAQLESARLSRFWSADVPLSESDSVVEAFRVDDTLYVISDYGVVFSIQADVGLIRWAEKLAQVDSRIFRPNHFWVPDSRGPVCILTGEHLNILDRYSGLELYRIDQAELNLASAPVGALKSIFFISVDGRAYSYRLGATGSQILRKRWEVSLGSKATTSPVLFGEREILFATHGGLVVASSAIDKTLRWHFRVSGPILGDPAVNDSGIYVASMDRSVYKLNGQNGALVWRTRFPCELPEGPSVTTNTVYQQCAANGLTALDAANGKELWNRPAGVQFGAELRGQAAVLNKNRSLELVEVATGETMGALTIPRRVTLATNTIDDAIYLIARDGRIRCLRPTGVPFLTGRDAQQAAAKLNVPPQDRNASVGEKNKTANLEKTQERNYLRSRRDGE